MSELEIKDIAEALKPIVGEKNVIFEREKLEDYLRDETYPMLRVKPATDVVVVKPLNAEEVSRILKFANEHRIPVFPRGGGTGLLGGAVPTRKGIVLTTERMKGIEIDRDNLMVTVKAGVTLKELIEAADKAGLFFPLHPGDETAHVGGLITSNAGGVRAVKYGVMRNYVKGLEVVLPTGEILKLGGKLHKNNTGYDLMDLIIGSEGTLAIITEAILKLQPKPGASATLIIPYNTRHDAIKSVPKILQGGIIPLAIEYVERDLIEKAAKHIGEDWPVKEGNCYLLIIVVGENRDQILYESQKIAEICQQNNSLEILFAEPKQEQEKILRIRSAVLPVLEAERMVDGLDPAVPVASISEFLDKIGEPTLSVYSGAKAAVNMFSKTLSKEVGRYGIRINCVSPSLVETPGAQSFIEKIGKEKLVRAYPLGRLGLPGDVAKAVLFLASDEAEFITGQTLSVNGGYLTVC